jgi:hypothetical protein
MSGKFRPDMQSWPLVLSALFFLITCSFGHRVQNFCSLNSSPFIVSVSNGAFPLDTTRAEILSRASQSTLNVSFGSCYMPRLLRYGWSWMNRVLWFVVSCPTGKPPHVSHIRSEIRCRGLSHTWNSSKFLKYDQNPLDFKEYWWFNTYQWNWHAPR